MPAVSLGALPTSVGYIFQPTIETLTLMTPFSAFALRILIDRAACEP